MSVGLTLAGAMSSNQSTPGSSHSAGSAKSGKAAPDSISGERSAAESGSFGDVLKKGNADPAGKQTLQHEDENTTRNRDAKGHTPWRSFDLVKPHRFEGKGECRKDPDGTEETGPAADAGIELAISLHQPTPAHDDPKTRSADMPRGLAIAAAARDGAEGLRQDAKQPRQQRPAATASENRSARLPPAQSATQTHPEVEAGDTAGRAVRETLAADQSEAVRGASTSPAPAVTGRNEMKVTVISSQVSPVPVLPITAPGLSPTTAALVASLGSDNALPQHAAEAVSLALDQQSASARPVTTLKFQLHPAELGAVTVKLTGSGEQLTIEIQVESSEARNRLSTDSEAIVKTLRGMGYDIDRITVQQAPSTPASPGGATNRENGFAAQDGRSGERQDQSWRQESGQRHDQNARGNSASGSDRGEAGGRGVYI